MKLTARQGKWGQPIFRRLIEAESLFRDRSIRLIVRRFCDVIVRCGLTNQRTLIVTKRL
jgi:hypothetical protein